MTSKVEKPTIKVVKRKGKSTAGIPAKPRAMHGTEKQPRKYKTKPQPGFIPANALPKGAQLWKLANFKHPPVHFPKGAEQLKAAAAEYFQWCVDNPLVEGQLVAYKGTGSVVNVPKLRAFTYSGLCLFLGIHKQTWVNWRTGASRPELQEACEWIDNIMNEQKFTAGAAGLLNAGIISRDLGLADKTEITGLNGGAVETITLTMTAEEAAEKYRQTRDQTDDK